MMNTSSVLTRTLTPWPLAKGKLISKEGDINPNCRVVLTGPSGELLTNPAGEMVVFYSFLSNTDATREKRKTEAWCWVKTSKVPSSFEKYWYTIQVHELSSQQVQVLASLFLNQSNIVPLHEK